MAKLRGVTQREIIDLLDQTYFTSTAFETDFSGDDDVVFKIVFSGNRELIFVALPNTLSARGNVMVSLNFSSRTPLPTDSYLTFESPGIKTASVDVLVGQHLRAA